MSLPPIPQRPKDQYNVPIENRWALQVAWSQFHTALTVTLPSILRRLAADIDSHR